MRQGTSYFIQQASTIAADVDFLFAALLAVTVFFVVLIFGAVIFFAVRFRRRTGTETPAAIHGNNRLEVAWIVIPLVIVMIAFVWGGELYFRMNRPPAGAMEIFGVGKQWMWKFQHPEGPREINDLHVPTGVPVRIILTSEDVVHSFYVPAFRVKMDVVPGRYTQAWFEATKPGSYHLFCAEYCGTSHSGMAGRVIVMSPAEYEAWLEGRKAAAIPAGAAGGVSGLSMQAQGEALLKKYRCVTCHGPGSLIKAPSFDGLYGRAVELADGRTIEANDAYIRESILKPQSKIGKGFGPEMPTFDGQVTEEDILSIIQYFKSLGSSGAKEKS